MDKILLIPHGWLGDRFFTTLVDAIFSKKTKKSNLEKET
jgi:hypothetical protein